MFLGRAIRLVETASAPWPSRRRESYPAVTGTRVIVSLPKMSMTFTAMV
jgi:hypothetical protein